MLNFIITYLLFIQNSFSYLQLITLQNQIAEDEEFNIFLFGILLLGLIFIGICILIVILSLLIIFGFIALGALSTSVLVSIHKKSITAGFRSFVLLFSTIATTVLGTITFWFLNKMVHWWSQSTALLVGALIGFVSGLIIGLLAAYLIKIGAAFLKSKFNTKAEQ